MFDFLGRHRKGRIKKHIEEQRDHRKARDAIAQQMRESLEEPVQLPTMNMADLTDLIFSNYAASGIVTSGDAGSGKSVTMDGVFQNVAANSNAAVLYIDPAGDNAKRARNFCLANPSLRQRMVYINLWSPHVTVPLHPLHVHRTPSMTDVEYRARIEARVSYATHILLSAWGQEEWDKTPLLYQYTTLFLRSVALMGLPMAEVVHFIDPQSELFQLLAQCVPDYMSRMELDRLSEMKPKEAYDEIRSTMLRWRGFLSNELVQAMLGVTEGFVDCGKMIDERKLVIIDASNPGTLRPEDVQIMSNLWLCEWFDAVFTRREDQRRPSAILVDELPLFTPSFPMIERNLRLMRKTMTRFVGCAQGTQSFKDGVDSPMLQAMVGQTGIQIIHRHTAPRDTAFWSEFVNVQMYDPKKPKFVHTENELYQTGWSLFETVSYSINNAYADAAGGGHSQSQNTSSGDSYSIEQSRSNTLTDSVNQSVQTGQFHADTHSKSHQDGVTEQRGNHSGLSHDEQRIRDMFNQGSSNVEGKSSVDGTTDGTTDTVSRNETNGGSQSNAAGTTNGFSLTGNRNAGSSFDVSSSWNRTTNRSLNINYAQQWLPKYEWREVLKFIEWFSNEEQQQMIAGDIAREKDGGCHIVISGLGILRVRMPLCGDPFANAPHALYAELRKYVQQVKQLPIYHSTPNILAERKAQIQRTIVEFQKLTNSPSKPAIEDSNSEDSGVFQSETDLQQQFLRDLRHDNGELGI